MNLRQVCSAAILATTLLLAGGAFADEKAPVKIFEPVSVAGQSLQPGEYSLQWSGTGNVEIKFVRQGKVVATAPARVVETEKPAVGNGTTTTANDDGSRSISEIHFRGKKLSLELGGSQSASVK